MFGREKIAMIVAEFVGTFALASAFLAMLYGRLGVSYFEASAVGATLVVLMLMFARVETGFYNPAVTIGLWTLRKLETTKAIVFVGAQGLGGVVAWTVGEYFLRQPVENIANETLTWWVFAAEAVGAAILGMGVAAVYRNRSDGLEKALLVAGSLGVGMVVAHLGGNGIVNPAVAVGVQSWSFVYAAGPILGAVLGMNIYQLLFNVPATRVARVTSSVKTTVRKASKKRK